MSLVNLPKPSKTAKKNTHNNSLPPLEKTATFSSPHKYQHVAKTKLFLRLLLASRYALRTHQRRQASTTTIALTGKVQGSHQLWMLLAELKAQRLTLLQVWRLWLLCWLCNCVAAPTLFVKRITIRQQFPRLKLICVVTIVVNCILLVALAASYKRMQVNASSCHCQRLQVLRRCWQLEEP